MQPAVRSADHLIYHSPAVQHATTYNVSVQLDGTRAVPPAQRAALFTVFADPTFSAFPDGKKTQVGEVLEIEVRQHLAHSERQCADTSGTVPVTWAGHSNAEILIYFNIF